MPFKEAQTRLQGEVSECRTLGHADTHWIRVGHAMWRVVDQMRTKASDMVGRGLDIFHGYFKKKKIMG